MAALGIDKLIQWCLGKLHARAVYFEPGNTLQQIRYKTLFFVALLTSMAGAVIIVLQTMLGGADWVYASFFTVNDLLVSASIFILWNTGSLKWTTLFAIGPIVTNTLFSAFYVGGGIMHFNVSVVIIVPLLVAFLLGMRAAFLTALAMLVVIFGLYFSSVYNISPPMDLSENQQKIQLTVYFAVLMLMTTCIGGAFVHIT